MAVSTIQKDKPLHVTTGTDTTSAAGNIQIDYLSPPGACIPVIAYSNVSGTDSFRFITIFRASAKWFIHVEANGSPLASTDIDYTIGWLYYKII